MCIADYNFSQIKVDIFLDFHDFFDFLWLTAWIKYFLKNFNIFSPHDSFIRKNRDRYNIYLLVFASLNISWNHPFFKIKIMLEPTKNLVRKEKWRSNVKMPLLEFCHHIPSPEIHKKIELNFCSNFKIWEDIRMLNQRNI